MKKLIISVLGKDRPGILAAMSKVLLNQNCNVENVSQTILQTEFAGLFIVAVPKSLEINNLNSELHQALEPMDLQVNVKDLDKNESVEAPLYGSPFVVTTFGPDKIGLVAGITEEIAKHNVNVTKLKAVFKGGDDPKSNIMIYEIRIPENVNHQEFTDNLTQKADDLGLDISIQHRKIFEAINKI